MTTQRSPYVVGPLYDWAFFLLPPVVALLIGIAIQGTPFSSSRIEVLGRPTTLATLLLGTLVHAHLVAVFFRSYGNAQVWRLHRLRFIVAPVLLFAAIRSSPVAGAAALVLATAWDVWHSGAQTFGLARIYDRNAGNAPEVGRRLDFWLNQLLYAGPILAGVTMLDHVSGLESLEEAGVTAFTRVPGFMTQTHHWWTAGVVVGGTAYLTVYVGWYWLQHRRGYRVSPYKVVLLVSTGVCSLYAWGFDSWGQAFFIMNLVHALQYLALVWATEHRVLGDRLGLSRFRFGKALTLVLFVGIAVGYGAWAQLLDPDLDDLWAATIVVSLLHFWYDGFIWSVRRAQV